MTSATTLLRFRLALAPYLTLHRTVIESSHLSQEASATSRRCSPGHLVRALALPLLLAFSGCAGLSPSRMAPETGSVPTTSTGRSLRVMEVTGGKKSTFGGMDTVDNQQFQDSLLLALQRSGLFSSVSTERGDYELYANIRSQAQGVGKGIEYTGTILVTYRLVRSPTDTVWSESYESEYSSTTFSGAARSLRAREGAVRENLKSLIEGLGRHFSTATVK